MSKKEEKYKWYLEPKSEAINESIVAETAANVDGDTTAHMVRCADGKSHNLIGCSKELCETLANSKTLGTDFNVWRQNSRDAKFQRVNFLFKKKRRRQPVQKAAVP